MSVVIDFLGKVACQPWVLGVRLVSLFANNVVYVLARDFQVVLHDFQALFR